MFDLSYMDIENDWHLQNRQATLFCGKQENLDQIFFSFFKKMQG